MTRLAPARPPLRLERLEPRALPATYDLGAALDFNAFVFDDMTGTNSDIAGRVAVGRDAAFTGYSIGTGLPNSNGTRDDLIVGRDLTYTNGQVFNGNVVYGGTGTLTNFGLPNGTARQQAGLIDFAAARTQLTATSAALGAEAPNGRTTLRRSNLVLRGTNRDLDFFTVTADQLTNAKSICVMTPAGADVVINVTGDVVNVRDLGLSLRGADCSHILWNFYQATALGVSGVGLEGSILAPAAALAFDNGQIEGTVVAASFAGTGELHICPSAVKVVIPDPATLQGMVFVDGNANNQWDGQPLDDGFAGAAVTLTGTDSLGRRITRDTLSLDGGAFNFGSLWPGTYVVTVTPPQKYQGSKLLGIPGKVGVAVVGTPAVNQVRSIDLKSGDNGVDYLLPLLPPLR